MVGRARATAAAVAWRGGVPKRPRGRCSQLRGDWGGAVAADAAEAEQALLHGADGGIAVWLDALLS